jgi:hypothetical protein
MKAKTAMQELLEWVRKTLPMDLDTPKMIEAKIESLLNVEKEQILKFAQIALDNADCSYSGMVYSDKDISDIYKETYEKE